MNPTAILLMFGVVSMLNSSPQSGSPTVSQPAAPAHVVTSFRFEISAPFDQVSPLFGAAAERRWAGTHWDPHFRYPQPENDVSGAVFTVRHGPYQSVWVNTLFDVPGGRMQYVSFIPDMMVTTVNVKVTALKDAHTAVDVTYARTALDASVNEHVRQLGEGDAKSGPEWQSAIENCLNLRRR